MDNPYHLAQANIAYAALPLSSPEVMPFHELGERVDALVRKTPGFIWRLEVFNDRPIDPYAFNVSVWESREALSSFVYGGLHGGALRRRKEWFKPYRGVQSVLWWLPAGQLPSAEEGMARLETLQAKGPTADAFTLRRFFPPPSGGPASGLNVCERTCR